MIWKGRSSLFSPLIHLPLHAFFPAAPFFPQTTIHVKIDTLFYTPMKCAYYTVSFVPHYLWSPHSKIDPRAFIRIIRLSNFHLKTSIFNREAWINNAMCKLIVQQIHWDTSVSQILIHSFNSPFETDWSAFVVSMLHFCDLLIYFDFIYLAFEVPLLKLDHGHTQNIVRLANINHLKY